MAEKGISCGIHYPIPIHLQNAYQFLRLKKGSFPIAEQCAEGIVSLPMFPELTKEQIEFIAAKIKGFMGSKLIFQYQLGDKQDALYEEETDK